MPGSRLAPGALSQESGVSRLGQVRGMVGEAEDTAVVASGFCMGREGEGHITSVSVQWCHTSYLAARGAGDVSLARRPGVCVKRLQLGF